MALLGAPAFSGKLTITSGVNSSLHWFETGPFNLSISIPAGDYWPDDLAVQLSTDQSAASTSSGAGNGYDWVWDLATGKFSVGATGPATFYLKAQAADTNNILHGGGLDSSGGSLAGGQWGQNGMGWLKASSYPSAGSDATGDQNAQHYWAPQYPPQSDDDGLIFESTHTQNFAIDGTGITYDFMGWLDSTGEFPTHGGLSRLRRLSFQFVTTAIKALWIHQFWGPYGKQGKEIRYYPNRSVDTFESFILTGESLRNHGFESRILGYQWWEGSIALHRVFGT